MDFRLLGPLEVYDGDRPLSLGGGAQRALLAVLLMRPNEVVSVDRLIDELWGEAAPPTAAKIIQNHVSRLRRSLQTGDSSEQTAGPLETHGRGYLIRVGPGELDIDRFESLLEAGRRDLNSDPEVAAATLGEALSLWRGPPLADFTYEPFAEREIARLEERQLLAVEARVDAELAIGKNEDLVPELEKLIAEHPLRERLRGQLMIALYRSGRQAEALDSLRQARALLVGELGLEPGEELRRLEQAILRHDPSLDPPRGREPRPTLAPRPRRRRNLLGGLALVGLLGAGVILIISGNAGSTNGRIPSNSVASIDPASAEVANSTRVGSYPTTVAVGEGFVWTLNADDRTISRLDPESGAVRTIATGSTPTDLAVGAGALWVGNESRSTGAPVIESLSRLDPTSGRVVATTRLPSQNHVAVPFGQTAGGGSIAVAHDAVWTVNGDSTVSQLDPTTGRIVGTIDSLEANTIAARGGEVWATTFDGTIARLDPRTTTVKNTIRVDAASLNAIAIGGGAVWVTDPSGGSVWRVDSRGPRVVQRTIPVMAGVTGIAYGRGGVWALNSSERTVTKIDPASNLVAATLNAGANPLGVAVGAGSVWVSAGESEAGGVSTGRGGPGVAGAPCGNVQYAPKGDPSYLIVSDLPLQGRSQSQTQTIATVVREVLARHDFHAGPYSIGYQSCDDSTAQAQDFEFERCAANAHAYAGTPRVLGVIGAYNSDCTRAELPIVGAAPGGPVPMVSPSNSAGGLTQGGPTHPSGELARLYPTGVRGYFRVYPADDIEAAAMASFAHSRGLERAFVLRDSNQAGYSVDIASYFRKAARKRGIDIAGAATWNARANSYHDLAVRIGRSGADVVVLAGSIESNGGRLIRDLRRVLGPAVVLLGGEGFSRGDDVLAAGGNDAQGMFAAVAGTPPERLGPAGRRFMRQFDRARPGYLMPDYFWAPYAAQATEVLLDAIRNSDGTRASVIRQLRRTRVRGGVLGDFRFDQNGDITPAAITVLKVERGGPGFTRLGQDFAEGTRVQDVIEVGGR